MIIDVAALDVLDSFGSRTLRNIAEMARLRGAVTVIVGIQPDVAFAMVMLGMDTGTVHTALDLEEGWPTSASCGRHRPTPGAAREHRRRPAARLSGGVPSVSVRPGGGPARMPATSSAAAPSARVSAFSSSRGSTTKSFGWCFEDSRPEDIDGVVEAASEFFLEVLATYHMIHAQPAPGHEGAEHRDKRDSRHQV